VRENTDPDDILLIYGLGQDPSIPYYSQHRALMNPWGLPLENPKMQKAIELLGKDNIHALLACDVKDPDFLAAKIRYFDLDPKPIWLCRDIVMFIRKDRKPIDADISSKS